MFNGHNENEEMTGMMIDRSNPNAPKVIKSKDIKSFSTDFMYYGDETGLRPNYFSAKKQDDGKVKIVASFDKASLEAIVEPEFLVRLQDVIDDNKLAGWNGEYKVTSGLPDEPTNFVCRYESNESLYFTFNANPDSRWMRDIRKLFISEFPDYLDCALEAPMTYFFFRYTSAPRGDNYHFAISKYGDEYHLSARFFDAEKTHEYVTPEWDAEEDKEMIRGFYLRLVKIYLDYKLDTWNGFDKYRKDILDGYTFHLEIEFERGEGIKAKGSNSYPDTFHEAYTEIRALMDDIEKLYFEGLKTD